MDATNVISLVSQVGFPIAMGWVMAWYIKDTNDKHREEVRQLNEQHNEEMQQITAALNNNTLALQRLCDKLGEEIS